MTNYELLIDEAFDKGLSVKEKPLRGSDGRIKGNRIAIRQDIDTQREKACVLAEELGHHYTSSGNILDQTRTEHVKQEQRARMWAYNKQIGLYGIINAYKRGCRNIHEMADYLDVTEEFLWDALEAYRLKYGHYVNVDNYTIYFEPYLMIADFDSYDNRR